MSTIQAACDEAAQAHSRAALTVIAPTPPDGPNNSGVPDTVVWHRSVELGLVTLVEVELPHAARKRAAAAAITAFVGRRTCSSDAGRSPLQPHLPPQRRRNLTPETV